MNILYAMNNPAMTEVLTPAEAKSDASILYIRESFFLL